MQQPRTRKRLAPMLAVGLVAALGLGAAACGDESEDPTATDEATQTEPAEGEEEAPADEPTGDGEGGGESPDDDA